MPWEPMRFVVLFLIPIWAFSCAPVAEPSPQPRAAQAMARPVTPDPLPSEKTVASHPAEATRLLRVTLSGVVFEGVAFDARHHRLAVVEQKGAPGTRFADAEAAARNAGGIAAVNGGFFTPEGEPLGLVMADGRRFGAWNSATSLGGGVWHVDAAGNMAISRRQTLGKDRAMAMPELLQAGPMLVEHARAVGGLANSKTSARTVILWDGGHRWWIGRSAPCTLARCAEILAATSPAGWPVKQALNLDGGRSSELWVSEKIPRGPWKSRPFWNKPVRNFLVLE